MASLDKYGVPIDGEQRQTMNQPKRKDHFRVLFEGFGNDSKAITLETNTVGQPSVSYESHEVNAYNSKMYYKGKYAWNTIEVSIKDTVDNKPLTAVLQQMSKEFNHFTQESRKAASSYKFKMRIEQLDGTSSENSGGVLNGWLCEGCMLTDISFGDGLDFSTSDFGSISITIQPDNCLPLAVGQGMLEDSSTVTNPDQGILDNSVSL